MDDERRRHLLVRLRRVMRAYDSPFARDVALAAEKLYAVTQDPEVPIGERRKAVSAWLNGMKELAHVERRMRGGAIPPGRRGRPDKTDAFAPLARRRTVAAPRCWTTKTKTAARLRPTKRTITAPRDAAGR